MPSRNAPLPLPLLSSVLLLLPILETQTQLCSACRCITGLFILSNHASYSPPPSSLSIQVLLWFPGWETHTRGQYFFVLVFIFLLGLVNEFITHTRVLLLRRYLTQNRAAAAVSAALASKPPPSSSCCAPSAGDSTRDKARDPESDELYLREIGETLIGVGGGEGASGNGSGSAAAAAAAATHVPRLSRQQRATIGAMYTANVLIGFLLMLAAMTYNVGVFLATVAGIGGGWLCFFREDESLMGLIPDTTAACHCGT
jgi:hypothetical protein